MIHGQPNWAVDPLKFFLCCLPNQPGKVKKNTQESELEARTKHTVGICVIRIFQGGYVNFLAYYREVKNYIVFVIYMEGSMCTFQVC